MLWQRAMLLVAAAVFLQMLLAPWLRFLAWWPLGARPDLFLALALAAAAFNSGESAFVAFWFCGLLHDVFAGDRGGVSTLLFLAIAWPAQQLQEHWRNRPLARQLALLGINMLIFLLRMALEEGCVGAIFMVATWFAAAASSLLVLLLAAVIGVFLGKTATSSK